MQFLSGKMVMAALGLFGVVAAAPAAAEDATQIAPISAVAAVSAMTLDDSATNKASSMAEARRAFLAALANERTDAAALARMLPRAGQPVAALIGAAPAGSPRAEAVLARLGLNPDRCLGHARPHAVEGAGQGRTVRAPRATEWGRCATATVGPGPATKASARYATLRDATSSATVAASSSVLT